MLKMIEEGPLPVRVWNPKIYPSDKSHRMPVITPAYPSMCSTHNVTQSTQKITTGEFKRAAEIVDTILLGKETWSSLFQKDDFFHRYKYYLQVIVSSVSSDIQVKWAGLVESRLRQLVMKLELVENLEIAHPYIKGFEKSVVCKTEMDKTNAHHGVFTSTDSTQNEMNTEKEGDEAIEPIEIWTTIFYVGIGVAPKDPNSNVKRELDITWPTIEFTKLVKSWDQFDVETMGIVIKYIKRYIRTYISSALPLDVFDESEVARVRKKRQKASKVRAVNKK
jgi:poly(A) polymerase